MIDSLIIGFNDTNFEKYVSEVSALGADSGAYRELSLHFIKYKGQPYRSMDILNHFYFQERGEEHELFHNQDFLSPTILYLGTYLTRKGLTFDYINSFQLQKDALRKKLVKNNILTIAITTTLYVTPYPILEIISFIKKYNKRAKIIIGGPYVLNQVITSDPVSIQYLFKYIGADFYVVGSEGEFALAKIIQALKRASSFDDIDNIAYKNGNHYRLTAQTGEDNSLEENTVNYNLFPKEEIGEFVSLRTSKSCPFACAFCGFPERGGKYKYLSSDLVEQELNAIRDLGKVTTLTFIDDTFNVPQKRFKEILRMMIRNKYEFKWNCYYRCDHGDEETIALMREAGCEGVFLGVESGSDDILKRMNKRARRKDYLETIPKFRAFDISTHASLIVGFPGETHKTMRETRGLIEETKPDFFRAQLWYYDPITPVWKQREEYGIKGAGFEWSHKTMDSSTACELAEEMFLSVENAIWLPQNGFEQWSTFYLQRKGLTLTQIKTFLRCYNAIIKDQLIYPERQTVDPDLLDNLARSCQLHDPVRRDIHPLPINTGTGGDDGAHAQGKERRLRAAIEKEVFRF